METDFRLPSLGEHIESGDVLSILVEEGQQIHAEQGVLEIETDKATVEVPCPIEGRVSRVHVSEGQTVPVGAVLLTLDVDQDSATKGASQGGKEAVASAETTSTTAESSTDVEPPPVAEATSATAFQNRVTPDENLKKRNPVSGEKLQDQVKRHPPGEMARNVPAGPSVRRLARELGIDLSQVMPADGHRINREDVQSFVRETNRQLQAKRQHPDNKPGIPDSDAWGIIRREPLSKIRNTIARRMFESYSTIPQLTNFDDTDISDLEQIRQASKQDYISRGIKLTTMPFLIKATASALKKHSLINASFDEENQQIIYKEYIHVGIAVDTLRGLVVPVIRDVDQLSIPEIAVKLADLAETARQGKCQVDDLRGGTFTISNLGAVGGRYSTPIINPPEVAILLSGRARRTPTLVEERVEARLILPLSLTYDHRLVDGAAAARFLNEVKGYLTAPGRLLLAP